MNVRFKSLILMGLMGLCLPLPVSAQEATTANLRSEADVMAQQRSVAINVNLFTGIPQLTVPVFAYQRGDLKLNVGLSYFAGGVQVKEDPTETGMSWSLDAGGIVTRSVRGIPDDFPEKGYLYVGDFPAVMHDSIRLKYYNNQLDAQADVYTFNCNGLSGRFMIGKDKVVRLFEQKNIKIQPEFTATAGADYTLSGFTIIAADGVRYEFRETDLEKFQMQDATAVHAGKYYPVAWRLTRQIAPFDEDIITYKYRRYKNAYSEMVSETAVLKKYDKRYSTSSIDYERNTGQLEEIALPAKQFIRFGRNDEPYQIGSLIESISILDNEQVKDKYRFYYTIYDHRATPRWIENYALTNGSYLRLDLKAVRAFLRTIVRETPGGTIPQYEFVYNTQYELPSKDVPFVGFPRPSTPEIGGTSRDHWGFFNGIANFTGIPTTTDFAGGNRNPSDTYVLAGSLRKVTFPDGMIREYEFESHDRVSVTNSEQGVYVSAQSPGTYTMNLRQHYTNNHRINVNFDLGYRDPDGTPAVSNYVFQLLNSSGAIVDTRIYDFNTAKPMDGFVWELNQPSGTYTLKVLKGSGRDFPLESSITLSWANSVVNAPKVIGGGLRIKKVTAYPGNNSISPVTTAYKYVMADGVTSSGYMAQFPNYEYHQPIIYSSGSPEDVRILVGESLNNLSYTSGNPVGYSRVEVIEGSGNTGRGKTVFEFADFRDIGYNPVQMGYPYIPVEKAEWGLGLPKTISTYDSYGNLKKQVTNLYSIIQQPVTGPTASSMLISHVATYSNIGEVKKLRTDAYYPLMGRTELQKVTETTYYNNNDSVSTITSYTYRPAYFDVKTITSSLDREKGLNIEKRYYYNNDYTIQDGIFKTLKDKNITRQMAEEEWITGDSNPRMIGGDIIEYGAFNNLVRPYRRLGFATNAPVPQGTAGVFNPAVLIRTPALFKVYAVYLRYDKYGFLQSSQENGKTTTMMLGADRQRAIMTADNVNYNDVAYTSFEIDEKGNFSYAGEPVTDENAPTGRRVYNLSAGPISRSGIPQTAVYTLSFWSKGNEPVVGGAVKVTAETNSYTGWTYREYRVSQAAISIAGNAQVDEIRLFPEGVLMQTTTYDPLVGVTSECGADNKPVYYSYDAFKRLSLVKNDRRQILAKKEYMVNGPMHKNPIWMFTGAKRCLTDKDGNTGYQEAEQTNINTNSPSWGNKQWVQTGKSPSCHVSARYELTGRKRCIVHSDGSSNGDFESEWKDMNPHSSSFGATYWVVGGNDLTMCPEVIICVGEGKRMVNGKCETGRKVITESEPQKTGWRCVYEYHYSDGYVSQSYDEYSTSPCM
ncbi:hypothetical protein ECE50_005335 [Chitinophaga sp. Mgbs1]|uniref:YD repeat-containing protein n=1 Tax=Chitinophaga solisilvae TaxID=1233460 RepID=A0A9Q5GKH7_9BACT|nr:hypothetical protein [Chitinophaga solisilvae]